MLRSVTLGVALSLLAAACALVGPLLPPGETRAVEARVINLSPDPVEITVRTPAGVLPGAVQPTSRLEADSTTDVTFYVPLGGEWAIVRDGTEMISSVDISAKLGPGCSVHIYLRPQRHGAGGAGSLMAWNEGFDALGPEQ